LTGLAAALASLENGLSVAVIEHGRPGAGASGRNSGFVIPTLARLMPADIERMLGGDAARKLIDAIGDAAAGLFEALRTDGADIGAMQTGWLQPDTCDASAQLMRTRFAAWKRAGANVRLLGADEVVAKTGSSYYRSALFYPDGGQIDPLALTRHLCDQVLRQGGTLLTELPVLRWSRPGAHSIYTVETSLGSVRGRSLIVASNANSDDGTRRLRRATIPFALVLATFALDPAYEDRVLPAHAPMSDSRKDMWFFRRLGAGRILTGMIATSSSKPIASIEMELRCRIETVFRSPAGDMQQMWAGQAGLTPNGLPQIFGFDEGSYGWTGCNGRGLVLSVLLGKTLAALAAGDNPERQILPVSRFKELPGRRLMATVGRSIVQIDRWKRARDPRRFQ